MQRTAQIKPIIGFVPAGTAQQPARKTHRRRKTGLGRAVGVDEIRRVRFRAGRVSHEELAQRGVQSEFDVILQKPHDAHVEARKADPRVEQAACRPKTEIRLGDQHLGRTEVDDQLISPDRELDVVGGRGCLFDFVEDRRIENDIHQGDGIERRRLGIKHRILAQLIDRVILEELDQSERHRN